MDWSDVGSWLKQNAGKGAALVGSLVTGNVPGAVAAGISLISSATGESDPTAALETLQTDPATVVRLRELANEKEKEIRDHIETMERLRLEDDQKNHEQTQTTIRSGDNAQDEYVRHTRPWMARWSFIGGLIYIALMELFKAFDKGDGASWELAGLIFSMALTYMGVRTVDKIKGRVAV